jgi:CheY-like chemotaxis protein
MTIRRVLLVDDEPDIRKIGALSLQAVGGWEVLLAANAEEGLALARQRPDVVLLDVMMPGMDGPTLLKHLRQLPEGVDIPVVFMTAKVQRIEMERYLSLGALGVIQKPFDPMTLPEEVRRLVGAR